MNDLAQFSFRECPHLIPMYRDTPIFSQFKEGDRFYRAVFEYEGRHGYRLYILASDRVHTQALIEVVREDCLQWAREHFNEPDGFEDPGIIERI